MKSLTKRIEKYAEKHMRDKTGAFGMNETLAFIGGIFGIFVLSFVIIIVMSVLNNSSILTSGSLEDNVTNGIYVNITNGIGTFFGSATTWFSTLAVAVTILIIVLLIGGAYFLIQRFSGGTAKSL